MAAKSELEEKFYAKWVERYPDLPKPDRQHKPIEGRKFAWDFSWEFPWSAKPVKLAVEIQGGGARGRHNTVRGQYNDYEKHNLAVQRGWTVLYFNTLHFKDLEGIVDLVADVLTGAEDRNE